jgi:hypothetical protein
MRVVCRTLLPEISKGVGIYGLIGDPRTWLSGIGNHWPILTAMASQNALCWVAQFAAFSDPAASRSTRSGSHG